MCTRHAQRRHGDGGRFSPYLSAAVIVYTFSCDGSSSSGNHAVSHCFVFFDELHAQSYHLDLVTTIRRAMFRHA